MSQHTMEKASEKQISFMLSLASERVSPTGTWKWSDDPDFLHTLTKKQASHYISRMKALPRKQKETLEVDVAPLPPVEGVHSVKTPQGVVVVKVQTAVYGSGRLYTKVWSPSAKKFVKQAGWLKKVSASTLMNKEEAKAFGQTYGCCARCSRVLTDEDSISRGFGPVCAAEMGW